MTYAGPVAIVPEHDDRRSDGPMTGGERAVLGHWLDLYRDTVMLKIAGLNAHQLALRPLFPSAMSLQGVVRHLTGGRGVLAARRAARRAGCPGLLLHALEP